MVEPSRMMVALSAQYLVGAVDDLVELVGDDDGGQALLLEFHQQVQQHLGVLVVEGGGGLVQNQEPHLLGEGLGDLHQLLLAGADVLDQGLGRLVQPHLLHMLFGLVVGLVPVDKAEFVFDLIAQEHVFSNGQQRDQGQFLVNNDDAHRLAVLLVLELTELSVIVDFAGVAARRIGDLARVAARRVGPGEHVHQCGFSRAVFPDQRVDLAFLHLQVHVVQRFHAGELLGDGAHFQKCLSQTKFLLSAAVSEMKTGRGRRPARWSNYDVISNVLAVYQPAATR